MLVWSRGEMRPVSSHGHLIGTVLSGIRRGPILLAVGLILNKPKASFKFGTARPKKEE